MTNDTDWQLYACWTLGQVSDDEYADSLEQRMHHSGREDPVTTMLVERLRGTPGSRERFFRKTFTGFDA